jgi:hypothetical protein
VAPLDECSLFSGEHPFIHAGVEQPGGPCSHRRATAEVVHLLVELSGDMPYHISFERPEEALSLKMQGEQIEALYLPERAELVDHQEAISGHYDAPDA